MNVLLLNMLCDQEWAFVPWDQTSIGPVEDARS